MHKLSKKGKNGKNGAPIANVVVNATSTIATIAASALTDSSGVANLQIQAGTARGAGTATVTVTDAAGVVVTSTFSFQVGTSGLRLGYMDADGQFIENEIGIEPDALLASQAIAQLSLVFSMKTVSWPAAPKP